MKWDNSDKEFICKQCLSYLDVGDLVDGDCPNCESDEDVFINDKNED